MAFREREQNTPELVDIERFPSVYAAYAAGTSKGNMTCKNNRVFLQSFFQGGYHFPSGRVEFERGVGETSVGLAVFDYSLNLIGGFDFDTRSPRSTEGVVTIVDSILYITNYISDAHAQFGDITFNGETGHNYAVVAKYVDTAFMTPYVHTGDTGNVRIVLAENDSWIAAYPNPFRQRVVIQIENSKLKIENGIVTAILTDLSGRREEMRLTPIGSGQYSLDLTSRPQATYLLTLTTADGKQHTVRLLKQSDIFGE